MKKKNKIFITATCVCIIIITVVSALFISMYSFKLTVKNIIDINEKDECTLQVCFQTLPGIFYANRHAFMLNGNGLSKDKETYTIGFSQNYPDSSIKNISSALGFDSIRTFETTIGQVYMYRNFEDYELYIVEGEFLANSLNFNIILKKGNDVHMISIPHLPEERIYCIYNSEQNIYLFSTNAESGNINMFILDSKEYTYEKCELDISVKRIPFDNIIVREKNIYIISKKTTKDKAKLLSYNIETKACKIFEAKNRENIFNIFTDNEKIYLLIGRLTDEYYSDIKLMCLDYDLNEIYNKDIRISDYISNYGLSTLQHCYLYENKIYGTLSGDSRQKYAAFIYDISKQEIIYLSELITSNNGYSMVDNTWLYNKDGKFYYIR